MTDTCTDPLQNMNTWPGVIGGIAVLAFLAFVFWLWWR